ncbi:MAG: PQQ-binding-like beta-propeller repeat protein [Clostridioides difficile]|nr:PQQ-binding-like beta-propeller repeat protein [Clostridioides difficile]
MVGRELYIWKSEGWFEYGELKGLDGTFDPTTEFTDLNTLDKTVIGAINENKKANDDLKQSVSNGKQLIATAITDKGVLTQGSDTFNTMADNIGKVKFEIEIPKDCIGVATLMDKSKYGITDLKYENTKEEIEPILVWKYNGHVDYVNSVAVDNKGYIYTTGRDKMVHKIDSEGNLVWEYGNGNFYFYNSVAVNNEGYIYSGGTDNTVHKIDSEGNLVWKYTGHTNYINSVAVDNKGFIYFGGRDNTIHKIDPEGNLVWKYTGHTNYINSVAVDNKVLFIVGVKITQYIR